MTDEEFSVLIERAVAEIPARIRARMENVAIVIDDVSTPAHGYRPNSLFGLYQGIPLPRRGGPGYTGVLPDKITIFKKPILEAALDDPGKAAALVRDVVHHEIAHYFGFSESEVRRWERKRAQKKTA